MTEDEIIEFVGGMAGVVAVTADEASGAPEVAWGDTFFFYDPDGDVPTNRRQPFATIVTKDYQGFDTASQLDRPGVFRLNISVTRDAFRELVGYTPAAHKGSSADVDYTATDRLLPHPVYAPQSWLCVLNPGNETDAQVRFLLKEAWNRAAERHTRRS
ncbi:MAG: DUF6194 family protein [Egibacteraceae bacterium]